MTVKELESATCNDSVSNRNVKATERQNYNRYLAEEDAQIGKYAAENSPTRASKQFSEIFKNNVPEPTARRLKAEYINKLEELSKSRVLPTKAHGRPLLLYGILCQNWLKHN